MVASGGAVYLHGNAHITWFESFILAVLSGRHGGKKIGDKELGKRTRMSLEDKANGKASRVGGQTGPHFPGFQVSGLFKNLPVCRVGMKKTEK